ncbi:MAG: hypothetical protein K8S56_00385 [Candidatus Cloacimonetes bacterium]|nr:hypothetical protein [Candidatus Cloacimonadota bacterium]
MAYWGNQPPVLYYGTSYANSWDLATVDCSYHFSWLKDRVLYQSVISGKIISYDKAPSSSYGRMSAELLLFNLTPTEMTTLIGLRDDETVKLKLHGDSTGSNIWEVVFVVQEFKPFASGEIALPYPAYDSAILRLVSQDYIDLRTQTT